MRPALIIQQNIHRQENGDIVFQFFRQIQFLNEVRELRKLVQRNNDVFIQLECIGMFCNRTEIFSILPEDNTLSLIRRNHRFCVVNFDPLHDFCACGNEFLFIIAFGIDQQYRFGNLRAF